jgi:hypothetical protein
MDMTKDDLAMSFAIDAEQRLSAIDPAKDKKKAAALIADAAKTLPQGGAEQIADSIAAYCRKYGIDPQAPEIASYYALSKEYKEREQRQTADAKAKTAAEAIAKDAGDLAGNFERGVSVDQPSEKGRDEIQAAIQRIAQNAAALQDTDSEPDRVGTWAAFETDCKTYNPDKDFRPAILAGLSFPDGTLSYIGARTGRGKTTIMLNIAREALTSDKPPRKVLFITLEESRKQLLRKLILSTAYGMATQEKRVLLEKRADPAREDGRSVKHDFYTVMRGERGLSGEGAKEFYKLITQAKDKLAAIYGQSLIIYEAQGLNTLERVEAAITEYAQAGDIVLVDYVQRLPAPYGFKATDFMLGKAQSNGLFTTAKRTGTVILSGAQFNRASTKEKVPAPAGYEGFDETAFREAGDIEQDAHNALGIGKDTATGEKRYIKVMKTREDASSGSCYTLYFIGAYAFMGLGKPLTINKGKAGKEPVNENWDDLDPGPDGRYGWSV